MTAFDVRYDGNVVRFYDKHLNEFEQTSLTVQCIRSDLSEIVDGFNKLPLRNGMLLVSDSTIRSPDQSASYGWYVLSSALIKTKIKMNTDWNPAYLWIETSKKKVTGDTSESNNEERMINGITGDTNLIVVPDLITAFHIRKKMEYRNFLILPLLETIANIFPIYTGLTLSRLVARILGGYDEEWMDKPGRVMCVLFGKFVNKFNEISTKEACPFSELHSCLFRNTFKQSIPERPPLDKTGVSFYCTKPNERVIMTVKSSLFSSEDYGDIAWSLATDAERASLAPKDKVRHWNGIFIILPEDTRIQPKGESITYQRLVVFPRMEIGQQIYEYGSMMGLTLGMGLDYRGPLFEDMSPREEMIIQFLFDKFINGSPSLPMINAIELFRMTPIPGKCRPDFIEKIKREFIKWRA
jgi:hypothetical protein